MSLRRSAGGDATRPHFALRGAPLTDPRTRHRRSDMTSSSVGRYSHRFGDRWIGRLELIEPPAERVGNRSELQLLRIVATMMR
jgi:hypothetical protein